MKKDDGKIVAYVPNAPNAGTSQVFWANAWQWREMGVNSIKRNIALKKLGKGL